MRPAEVIRGCDFFWLSTGAIEGICQSCVASWWINAHFFLWGMWKEYHTTPLNYIDRATKHISRGFAGWRILFSLNLGVQFDFDDPLQKNHVTIRKCAFQGCKWCAAATYAWCNGLGVDQVWSTPRSVFILVQWRWQSNCRWIGKSVLAHVPESGTWCPGEQKTTVENPPEVSFVRLWVDQQKVAGQPTIRRMCWGRRLHRQGMPCS